MEVAQIIWFHVFCLYYFNCYKDEHISFGLFLYARKVTFGEKA
jgi:hypothetical protein